MQYPLSPELRDALAAHPGEPIELRDDASKALYVVLPKERFERLRELLAVDEREVREFYPAQERALGLAGWDEPEMDIYNDYDAHRP